MVARYKAGTTVKQLAAEYAVHHRTVKKRLQSAGGVIRERERKLSDRQITQAVRLYGQGMSTQQIGDVFKVSHNTVRRHLRNRGVQMRPLGRPPRQN